MQVKKLVLSIPMFMCAALLVTGSPAWSSGGEAAGKPAAAQEDANVVKGKVLGVSKKAKTITVETGKGPVMVKFNDATEGMDFAQKGEAAIVKFEQVGKDKVATVIKPKLAKLPPGVTEMMPEELIDLLASGSKDYMLIDSRPGARYAEAHIPTAVSITVPAIEKKGETLLPQDNKDKLLIFYCGGPT